MKIYDQKGLPNPMRVRVAAAEKGVTDRIEFVPVDVLGGEHKQPAFLAINPGGFVPVLELDDGRRIVECAAITEYFDHMIGEPVLTGRTAEERAEISMRQRQAEAEALDAVAAYFHHATPGLPTDAGMEKHPAWGEGQKRRAERAFEAFDALLRTRDHLAGAAFSVADITLAAALVFADFAKIEIPERLSALHGWRRRVTARPSFA